MKQALQLHCIFMQVSAKIDVPPVYSQTHLG